MPSATWSQLWPSNRSALSTPDPSTAVTSQPAMVSVRTRLNSRKPLKGHASTPRNPVSAKTARKPQTNAFVDGRSAAAASSMVPPLTA